MLQGPVGLCFVFVAQFSQAASPIPASHFRQPACRFDDDSLARVEPK